MFSPGTNICATYQSLKCWSHMLACYLSRLGRQGSDLLKTYHVIYFLLFYMGHFVDPYAAFLTAVTQ